MSRVIIKGITPGETLDVADVNDTVDSWSTATSPTGNTANRQGVDSDNIRDEGLDRRMFTKGDILPSTSTDHDGFSISVSPYGHRKTTNSPHNGSWHLFSSSSGQRVIGPFTYSPDITSGEYDHHMMLVRYHVDVFAAPSIGLRPAGGNGSNNWGKKTRVSTRLAYILSASTPTASSAWIPMHATTRRVQMGAFGFHAPISQSKGFNINGSRSVNKSKNRFWGERTSDYTALSNIFAGYARLRQNICASHLFASTESSSGTTGYSYTTAFTTQLYFGLQVKIDYWDDKPTDGKVTFGNVMMSARNFVR